MVDPDGPDEAAVVHRTRVLPEWVDYNGHMSEAFYVLVFGYTTDALLDAIGMDSAYRERTRTSLYTLEVHVSYLKEVREGEALAVTTRVLDVDHKRARVFHRMFRGDDLVATEEALLCNVDGTVRRSAPFAPEIAAALERLRDRDASQPRDERIGRSIGLPPRRS